MICKWCNREVENNVKFCQYCGGNLINSENNENVQVTSQQQIIEQPIVNQNNTNVQSNFEVNVKEEKVNIVLVLLSVFIPIAGLIIFLTKKDEDKKTAKASGIAALISFCVCFVLSFAAIGVITFVGKEVNDLPNFNNDNQLDGEVLESEEENLDSNEDNVINDWTTYQFVVNNQTIKLPCKFNELSTATETKMKSAQEKSYLSPGYYTLMNLYKNEKLALNIEIINNGSEDILYTDTMVTRVTQTKYQVSSGATVITFPGGLKAGEAITKEEIINLFGEPSDIYNYTSDGYISDTYSYFSDSIFTTVNNYKIKVVNGVIDEITLDHRHYQ